MSPEGPRFAPETKPDDNQDKKKKSKKGTNLRLPSLVTLENEPKDKPLPEVPGIVESLGKRREKPAVETASEETKATDDTPGSPDKAEVEKEVPKDKPETEQQRQDAEKNAAETTEPEGASESQEDYEPLPSYEPEPTEFSGGEVIISLQGDEPITERVIPLHPKIEPASEPAPAEAAAPASRVEQRAQIGPAERAVMPGAAMVESAPEPSPETLPPAPTETPVASMPAGPESSPAAPDLITPRPEDVYIAHQYVAPESAPAVPGGERPATKQEVADAVYYATRAGQNRGLLTGLLVGGGYEHFKHKRREKRAERRFQKQTKQLENARKDYNFGLQEQNKRQIETAARFNTLERHSRGIEKPFQNKPAAEKLPAQTGEQLPAETPEQLLIPTDHRLETSAWHSIEVDAKTGKPVENPTFQYGHEYYRERAQENTPAAQRNAATGEIALVAAAGAKGGAEPAANDANDPQAAPPIPDATTQGPPSDSPKDESKSASGAITDPKASGPLWPWLIALAVVVVLLAILL